LDQFFFMNRPFPPATDLPLRSPRASESLFQWLYRELREAILEGRLKPGAVLPPTRKLAAEHRIARGTVVRAYEQLLSEGYLESRVGSGTTVHRELPDKLFSVERPGAGKAGRRKGPAACARKTFAAGSVDGGVALSPLR
jgi:DNA-binding transcriptional MocR family regulator